MAAPERTDDVVEQLSGDAPTTLSARTTAAVIRSTPSFAREMVAGGVAGVVAKTAVAPLDRVKLMRQVGAAPRGAALPTMRDIARREGLAGLYRGNGANALRGFQSKAIHFAAYERYRALLLPSLGGDGPIVDLLAGSAAGGKAAVLTYPLDLARTRLAVDAGGGGGGVRAVLRRAYEEGGSVRGVYRGLCPSLARVLPASGLNFCAYEALKARVLVMFPEREAAAKVACGLAAGMAASTATYPLDVVRRQIQMGRGGGGVGGTLRGLGDIVREQGARQLYAGLGITYVKKVPSVAVSMVAYDHMKTLLMLPPRDHKD
uniref:ADP,ATP carrier protein n=1 Tax=Leersia perrieri TaxID=77586 RepID=A0A0D9WY70_9ORYZ